MSERAPVSSVMTTTLMGRLTLATLPRRSSVLSIQMTNRRPSQGPGRPTHPPTTSSGSSRPSSGTNFARETVLGVEVGAELRPLGPALVPGLLHDRGDGGVGDEALPAVFVPVEDRPDPVVLVGVAKDVRALGPMLLPLLGALGREDLHEAVVVLEPRRCQDHLSAPPWLSASSVDVDGAASMRPGGNSPHRANALSGASEGRSGSH